MHGNLFHETVFSFWERDTPVHASIVTRRAATRYLMQYRRDAVMNISSIYVFLQSECYCRHRSHRLSISGNLAEPNPTRSHGPFTPKSAAGNASICSCCATWRACSNGSSTNNLTTPVSPAAGREHSTCRGYFLHNAKALAIFSKRILLLRSSRGPDRENSSVATI